MMERREFVIRLGSILIVLPAAGILTSCGGDDTVEPGGTNTTALKFTSSEDGGHTHTFEISLATLANAPSAGHTASTSNDGGHTHTVVLNMDQLRQIESGSTVTVETTVDAMHTHRFTFAKSTGVAI
jgi:hypothetical protein